jgi:hypothetical protein
MAQEDDPSKCARMLEYAMVRNKSVHTLVDSILELGCPIPRDFLSCRKCPENQPISGGFIAATGETKNYKPKVRFTVTIISSDN